MKAYSLHHKSISRYKTINSYALKGFQPGASYNELYLNKKDLVMKAESVRIT